MAQRAAPPKSMKALRERLDKRYGNQVMRKDRVVAYEVLSTGSMSLDLAHRTGGWVEGRIHEIVGPEGVGKTTLVISSLVEAQRKYPKKAVGYIDMEQTFDYDWAEAQGLQTDDDHWVHIFPDDAEDVSDLLRRQAETGLFSMLVVDSIGGMESNKAFEKEAGEKVMGDNAQIITRMVKHCAVLARREGLTILLVNQLRADLNGGKFEQSAGPKALKYATTTKVVMSGTGGDKIMYRIPGDEEDSVIGVQVRARVVRSKVAVQGKKAEYYIIKYDTREYGPVGIDKVDEAVTIGLFTKVIEQGGGGYYTFPSASSETGTTRVRGKDAMVAHFRSDIDDLSLLRERAVATVADDVREEVEVVAEMVGGEE